VSARAQALLDKLAAAELGIVPSVGFDELGWDGRLAGIVSILVPGVDSETLVLECDQAGFEVSAASACSSGSLDASHVLLAMGIPRELALCSLRVSFDQRVDQGELSRFAHALADIVARRRGH
jgi:cysteine desulfurase